MRIARYPILALCAVLALSACRSTLPQYPWEGKDAVLATMLSYDRIETLSAACRLTLSSSKKDRIRLEGAIVASLPNHFRIQTWKFGRNAFDFIITPSKRWIAASAELKKQEQSEAPDFDFLLSWLNLNQLLDQSHYVVRQDTRTITLGPETQGTDLLHAKAGTYLVFDKSTRTCRRLYRLDGNSRMIESVSLSDWTLIDNRPWPLRLIATAPLGDVDIRMHDVHLNQTLPSAAFTPPRQAVEIQ